MHPADDGSATLIDVILNYFGESPDVNSVTALSNRQFEEFGELAVESAKAHYNSIPSKTDKPVYPGGFLSTFWSDNTFHPLLSAQLLYQPCLMLHDPIADFFNVTNTSWIPDMHEVKERLPDGRISIGLGNIIKCWIEDQTYAKFKKTSDFQSAKLVVGGIIHRVMALAPLIQHGVIILRPQYPIIEQNLQRILTSSRHDIKCLKLQRQRICRQDGTISEACMFIFKEQQLWRRTNLGNGNPNSFTWRNALLLLMLIKQYMFLCMKQIYNFCGLKRHKFLPQILYSFRKTAEENYFSKYNKFCFLHQTLILQQL
jgi:hypothetical protein